MPLLFVFLLVAGAVALYLSHSNQRWLPAPLPAWPARILGVGLLVVALGCALNAFSTATAIFAFLMLLMLTWALLPLVSLLPFFTHVDHSGKAKHGR